MSGLFLDPLKLVGFWFAVVKLFGFWFDGLKLVVLFEGTDGTGFMPCSKALRSRFAIFLGVY